MPLLNCGSSRYATCLIELYPPHMQVVLRHVVDDVMDLTRGLVDPEVGTQGV
jgi:hypothetical protein